MEITGKIIVVMPAREGVSQSSGKPWKSQEYVIETQEMYPKKCCFNVFGDEKIQQFNIHLGEVITVSIEINASEYQGRWYNKINAWQVQRATTGQQQGCQPYYPNNQPAQGQVQPQQAPLFPPQVNAQGTPVQPQGDGLPF